MNDEPVEIYQANDTIDATLILGLLADVGIQARAASHALEGLAGAIPAQTISIPIWVQPSDRDFATQILHNRHKLS